MNLCSDDHEEVCYVGINCPACQKQKIILELEEKIEKLESEVKQLNESE
jgi:hypothetical protein